MSYSVGMSQLASDQEEQDNLSGMDLCECWHEHNRRILDGFDAIRPQIIGEKNAKFGNTECSKTPF